MTERHSSTGPIVANGNAGDRPVTIKSLSLVMGLAVGFVSILGVIHGKLLMPAMLAETRQQTWDMIERHADEPHRGAVSQEEMQRLMSGLEKLATKEQCQRIEADIADMKARIRALERN